MHTTRVQDFTESMSSQPFASVDIAVDEIEQHITTSMSANGRVEVTLFFNSPAEIRQFATDLLTQASEASML